ncbi:hypothetical protein [Nonomuraea sp. LPB2021202275-12-8]|uniref:hypothetical protein n=1 Tax=Nonomuraea sp. LPB2021202275-12-8 TaxID=3120159 RepID=UPI00300CC519
MTVQDLRDVLRERAEGPSPANPGRHEQIRARIRATRLRRRAAGGVAASVTLTAAVALGVSLLPGAPPERPQSATVVTGVQPELPERFTAPDGTGYRRVATTSIKATGSQKATVTVPLSGRPLDVGAVCEGPDNSSPRVSTGAPSWPPVSFTKCSKRLEILPVTVPEGAKEVTITFDATSHGTACVMKDRDSPCEPVKTERGVWSLGVYEWTPPAQPVEPEQVRDFPDRLEGWELEDSRTGVWPQDTTARFEVEGTGRKLALDQICTGDLARRLSITYQVEGSAQSGNCGEWTSGPFPMAMIELPAVPKGERLVIEARMTVSGATTNRPIRWSVGVFSK